MEGSKWVSYIIPVVNGRIPGGCMTPDWKVVVWEIQGQGL